MIFRFQLRTQNEGEGTDYIERRRRRRRLIAGVSGSVEVRLSEDPIIFVTMHVCMYLIYSTRSVKSGVFVSFCLFLFVFESWVPQAPALGQRCFGWEERGSIVSYISLIIIPPIGFFWGVCVVARRGGGKRGGRFFKTLATTGVAWGFSEVLVD